MQSPFSTGIGPSPAVKQSGQAYALMNLGVASDALSQYPQAIHYYEQALAIFEVLPDPQGEAEARDRIRVAYYFLPESDQPDERE
jgi:tetratricopeptide (TPR) repeat protein